MEPSDVVESVRQPVRQTVNEETLYFTTCRDAIVISGSVRRRDTRDTDRNKDKNSTKGKDSNENTHTKENKNQDTHALKSPFSGCRPLLPTVPPHDASTVLDHMGVSG